MASTVFSLAAETGVPPSAAPKSAEALLSTFFISKGMHGGGDSVGRGSCGMGSGEGGTNGGSKI